MSCLSCYPLQYVMGLSITIPGGLPANTTYFLWVYKPNSNVKVINVTTDSGGNFTINPALFPVGFFNQYGGDYQIQLSTDSEGQKLVNMFFSMIAYQCVSLNFICTS